jgi:hypothetical protein
MLAIPKSAFKASTFVKVAIRFGLSLKIIPQASAKSFPEN